MTSANPWPCFKKCNLAPLDVRFELSLELERLATECDICYHLFRTNVVLCEIRLHLTEKLADVSYYQSTIVSAWLGTSSILM